MNIEDTGDEHDYDTCGSGIPPDQRDSTLKCPECGGTGGVDSGGVTPWGAGINVPCSCVREKRRRGMNMEFLAASIPLMVKESLDRYVSHGVPTGDFLCAVLENNLKMAYWLADGNSRVALPHIVQWLHWEAPPACHGSPEKVRAWIAKFKEGAK